MTPEDLLHLFGPFLATDRFRALLRGADLPVVSQGAALMVDMSGFTPLTTRLVTEHGPRRASEELKRRLNPMFEATAGQVFQHGGSVIRFVGDGFLAWFDDQQHKSNDATMPGVVRAVAAALNMQSLMPIFRGLSLKIGIGNGQAYRWVVGQMQYGLVDVLSGPAVEALVGVMDQAVPGQILADVDSQAALADGGVSFANLPDTKSVRIIQVSDDTLNAARQHRWPAWYVEADLWDAVDAVRPFIAASLRDSIEGGFSDFVGELRQAFPVFMRVDGLNFPNSRLALDHYVCRVQDVLAETGGRLVSVEVGDKGSVLFAVFGAPIAYGDDAERALSAALTLRDQPMSDPVTQQFGISRGLLYAGIVGGEVRHEYSTIGDETNVAARLMMAAAPGQILVTSHVRNEMRKQVEFHDLPALQVKGKESLIKVSEPLNIRRTIAHHAPLGDLIGRTAELDQFRKLLKGVAAGSPRVLRIEGQSGIGKSRLVAELGRLAVQKGFRAVGGDCVSTGRNTPYLPWREVLIALLSLSPDTPAEINAALLESALTHINPEWLTRLPLLGELVHVPIPDNSTTAALTGLGRQQALSTLVTDLIVYFAQQQPLMVLLEDVHWIDEVSEALTLDLARSLSARPVSLLLAITHRPLAEGDHGLTLNRALSELYIHTTLALTDLSRTEVSQLIERHMDATAPVELLQFVYDQARGNPFFIQEMLDTLEETGAIRLRNHDVTIERPLASVDLPQTVQGLIQARIDRLTEGDKLVLKVASVIGRQFQVRVLAESIPVTMPYPELLGRLQTLEHRDFSQLETSEPDLTYLFKHAVTHEVAYQSLLFTQRRQLHQAVGLALETLRPDDIERLAYHFGQSGNEQRERARRYLNAAAHKAAHEYANQAALDYLGQGLALAIDDVERFDLHCRRLDVLLRIGEIERAEHELAAAQAIADAATRRDLSAQLHLWRARCWQQKSAWQAVVTEALAALVEARALTNDELTWDSARLLYDAYLSLGDTDSAQALFRELKTLVERLNDPQKDVQLVLQELYALYVEQPKAALTGALAVLTYAESLDNATLETDCWALVADIHRRNNDHPAALNALKRQLALLRRIGNRRSEGQTLSLIGLTLMGLGQFSEASGHLQQAFSILHQIGERLGEALSLNYLGVLAGHRHAFDEGLAYLQRGISLIRELNVPGDLGLTLFQIGNLTLRQGDYVAAEAAFVESAGIFESLAFQPQFAEVQAGLAELALLTGDLNGARTLIDVLLPALEHGKVNDLQMPGLAYWRAVQVTNQAGQLDMVAVLRQAFHRYYDLILDKLSDPASRNAFSTQLWFHHDLLVAENGIIDATAGDSPALDN